MRSQLVMKMLWLMVCIFAIGESKVVSSDKNEVSNVNGTVVVVNIHDSNKTQYHNQNFRQGNYNYGYDIKPDGPNGQFHHENKAEDGVVYGCYGYIDPLDQPQITFYVSDSWGYRPIQRGQSIKVFYPKDHPEGTTEMKGNELKWTQLQFPKQCDNLEETILASSKPIQAEGSVLLIQSSPEPSPSPLSLVKKESKTPLSVILTYGPTATNDGVTGVETTNNGNSGYGGLTSPSKLPEAESLKTLENAESSVDPGQPVGSSGTDSVAGNGGNGGDGGKGGAAERSPGGDGGIGGTGGNAGIGDRSSGGNGGRGGSGGKGGSAERSPGGSGGSGGDGGLGGSAEKSPGGDGGFGGVGGNGGAAERSPGGNGGRGGQGGNGTRKGTGGQSNLLQLAEHGDAVGVGFNGLPGKTGSPPTGAKESSTAANRRTGTTPAAPAANEGIGYHRVPEIEIKTTEPGLANGAPAGNSYGQRGNDNYYAGSNKNANSPNSNDAPSGNQYRPSEITQNPNAPVRKPNTGYYRPASPTINYIELETPKFSGPLPGYAGSTAGTSVNEFGPNRLESSDEPQFSYGNAGDSDRNAPSPSLGIRNPTAQAYPSSEPPSRRPTGPSGLQGTYPSPTVIYEDPSGQNNLGGGLNYDNNGGNPVPESDTSQPSSGNGGCSNSGCNQQQPEAQDPQFIDYSQFPGAVVSNVPVIFYPDCRSNAFTRPAIVPFCPSLQPASHPGATTTTSCSHRQQLTMRFPPPEQQNNIYSNYNLPSTRGAYPTNNFVNTSNSPRQGRRVVRRSRNHPRQVQITN